MEVDEGLMLQVKLRWLRCFRAMHMPV